MYNGESFYDTKNRYFLSIFGRRKSCSALFLIIEDCRAKSRLEIRRAVVPYPCFVIGQFGGTPNYNLLVNTK